MSLLVTGSIGIDTVRTPFGVSKDCLGGSAVYFSMAASFFAPVRLVGVVGSDCPFDFSQVFQGREVDLQGLQKRPESKTFRWKGSYQDKMDEAVTEGLELNVLSESPPEVPPQYRDSEFLFLANTAPSLQMQLLEQVESSAFVAADTMNCWIANERDGLTALLGKIDMLIINENEARMLAGDSNLVTSAKGIIEMGPSIVVIKKGESGSIVLNKQGDMFILPAYPASVVKDPTGAGDSFAGGLLGYLAKSGRSDFGSVKKAVVYGTVVASYTISDFSLNGLGDITMDGIERKVEELRKMTEF